MDKGYKQEIHRGILLNIYGDDQPHQKSKKYKLKQRDNTIYQYQMGKNMRQIKLHTGGNVGKWAPQTQAGLRAVWTRRAFLERIGQNF